jgi:hypothetical protein
VGTQIDEKTYKDRNIKFLFSLLFLNIFSVAILLYLLSLGNFLPTELSGDYNLLNISVFVILTFIFLSSLISLVMYGFLLLFSKKESVEYIQIYVVKMAFILTFGLYFVIMLHFFHILNIYWGVGILVLLLVISFVL